MHICLLTPSFPPMVDGGVAIATGRLVQCLQQRGHRLTVLATASLASGTEHGEAPAVAARYNDLVQDPWHDAAGVNALHAWAEGQHRTAPFDVILAYFLYPAGYLATLLGDRLRLPVVCSCRGNDISKDMFMTPEIVATVLRRSTRLICVSDSLLHMADTLVPCRTKATVVANAVDSTRFCPAPQTSPD
ncbi:MAG: glycosyltransferase family 4 protein, partial [Candidatus Tectomicrobia bacterium]|nr:glycosyltransferase family 4 protein [Candidatus Tectomicrobia bacterium]